MKPFSKYSLAIIAFVVFADSSSPLNAQGLTTSGPANGKTCSQLAAECVSFNKAGGFDASRCSGYKASCMATGTYTDKKRTVTGVTKK